MKNPHLENNNHPLLPLDHNPQIKPHFKPAKGLIYENVLNRARGDEARLAGTSVDFTTRAGLDPEATDHEEGFGRVNLAEQEIGDGNAEEDAVGRGDL